MSFFDLIYSALSIILEAFPISSSGHLVMLTAFFKNHETTFAGTRSFDFILHGPLTILIPCYFFNDWFFMLRKFQRAFPLIKKIFYNGIIVDGITVVAYFLFFKNNHYLPLWAGFVITSLVLISLLWCSTYRLVQRWCVTNALILGFVQAFSLVPGISRLGTTYVTACWLGMRPLRAFQYSFLIEFPISSAAFLKGFYEIAQENKIVELLQLKVILVMIVATVCSFFCLKITEKIFAAQVGWFFSLYVMSIALVSLLV